MQAAVLKSIGQPLEVVDTPRPKCSPDDVVVETKSCGICRTDIHIQDGLAYVPSLPHIPGHEPAGVIAEVGERVQGWRVGDRVVPHLFVTCGACHYCRTGRDAQCAEVQGIIGVTSGGGFAQFFAAPARNLLRLPDNVSFQLGGLASCAVVTAVHAYRRARIRLGETAVVLGTGGIGLLLTQILTHAGAKVVGVGRSEQSLELARNAGASACYLAEDDAWPREVQHYSGGLGAACIFDCVGTSESMRSAAACAMRGGQIVVIGEEPEFPAIDTIQIAQRELEIIGSRNGSRQDAADALRWMSDGVIQPHIAAQVKLSDINAGLDLVRRGGATGRVIVEVG
jgi:propanol-preferring alcohol dehydrogenase